MLLLSSAPAPLCSNVLIQLSKFQFRKKRSRADVIISVNQPPNHPPTTFKSRWNGGFYSHSAHKPNERYLHDFSNDFQNDFKIGCFKQEQNIQVILLKVNEVNNAVAFQQLNCLSKKFRNDSQTLLFGGKLLNYMVEKDKQCMYVL